MGLWCIEKSSDSMDILALQVVMRKLMVVLQLQHMLIDILDDNCNAFSSVINMLRYLIRSIRCNWTESRIILEFVVHMERVSIY